jgi:hypothetical protein
MIQGYAPLCICGDTYKTTSMRNNCSANLIHPSGRACHLRKQALEAHQGADTGERIHSINTTLLIADPVANAGDGIRGDEAAAERRWVMSLR